MIEAYETILSSFWECPVLLRELHGNPRPIHWLSEGGMLFGLRRVRYLTGLSGILAPCPV